MFKQTLAHERCLTLTFLASCSGSWDTFACIREPWGSLTWAAVCKGNTRQAPGTAQASTPDTRGNHIFAGIEAAA